MGVEDVLAFERDWIGLDRSTGAYEVAMRERFAVTMTAYALRLTRVVDTAEAMALDPVTCRLVRARRSRGMKQGSGRGARR